MKMLLGSLATVLLATTLLASPAEARCWWNGYYTVCNRYGGGPYWRGYGPYWRGHYYGHRGYYGRGYYGRGYYGRGYYRHW